jgi:hypothetical protein
MDISNIDIPEHLSKNLLDHSGNKTKQIEILNNYRKQNYIDMVCRQTDLSQEDAEFFLTRTQGDVVSAIRLYMNGETKETLTNANILNAKFQKTNRTIEAPKTVNQQIYSQLRSFMDKCSYH